MNSNPAGQSPTPDRQLTIAQIERLGKAMGEVAFRDWFNAHKRGEALEMPEQLIAALDLVGEDGFRWVRIEKSPLVGVHNATAVRPARNETGGGPIATLPNAMAANGLPASLNLEWVARLQLAGAFPDSPTEASEMIKRGEWPAFHPINFQPSEAVAILNVPGAEAVERQLAIEASDSSTTKCEQCKELVPRDYSSRRSHVYNKHPPEVVTTELETQAVLKEAMSECFRNELVLNDLMCNDCGRGISITKAKTIRELQRYHVQSSHLESIAQEIFPLACPVSDCTKWSPTRPDERTLREHIRQRHGALTTTDKETSEKLFKRLKSAAEEALAGYFPHTPEGKLCVGARNKGRYTEKTAIVPPRSVKGTPPPIATGGEPEPSETACQECGEAVPSAYSKRREHVIGKHVGEDEMEGSVVQRQGTLEIAMTQCFPTATILNDLTCNYPGCGKELEGLNGKTIRQLRSWHIQEHHLPSATEEADTKIMCPVTDCSRARNCIQHLNALRMHLANCHGGVRGLMPADKEDYTQIVDRVTKATKKLLPECFPHTPAGVLNPGARQKRKALLNEEEEHFFLNRP